MGKLQKISIAYIIKTENKSKNQSFITFKEITDKISVYLTIFS